MFCLACGGLSSRECQDCGESFCKQCCKRGSCADCRDDSSDQSTGSDLEQSDNDDVAVVLRCRGVTQEGERCRVTSAMHYESAQPLRDGAHMCMHHEGHDEWSQCSEDYNECAYCGARNAGVDHCEECSELTCEDCLGAEALCQECSDQCRSCEEWRTSDDLAKCNKCDALLCQDNEEECWGADGLCQECSAQCAGCAEWKPLDELMSCKDWGKEMLDYLNDTLAESENTKKRSAQSPRYKFDASNYCDELFCDQGECWEQEHIEPGKCRCRNQCKSMTTGQQSKKRVKH